MDRGHGELFADWDNDGDQDLVVDVGSLLVCMRNDGQGHFETVQQLKPHATTYSLAAADYDNDGTLWCEMPYPVQTALVEEWLPGTAGICLRAARRGFRAGCAPVVSVVRNGP